MKKVFSFCTLALFLFCGASFSKAAVVVIEDFESYPSGTSTLIKTVDTATSNTFGWKNSSYPVASNTMTINSPGSALTSSEHNGGDRRLTGTVNVVARSVANLSDAISMSFEFSNPSGRVYMGFWNDSNNDSIFATSEMGIQFGYQTPAVASGFSNGFGFRVGNAGDLATSNTLPLTGKWYRATMDIGADLGGNRDLVLNVRNLTDGVDVVTNFTQNFTNAQIFGSATDFVPEGVSLRGSFATGGGLDNMTYTTTAIPEPSSVAALGFICAAGFARLRRHNRDGKVTS